MRPAAIGFDAELVADTLAGTVADELFRSFDVDGLPNRELARLTWSLVVTTLSPDGMVSTDWTLIVGKGAAGFTLTPEGAAVQAILAARRERAEP